MFVPWKEWNGMDGWNEQWNGPNGMEWKEWNGMDGMVGIVNGTQTMHGSLECFKKEEQDDGGGMNERKNGMEWMHKWIVTGMEMKEWKEGMEERKEGNGMDRRNGME